MKEVHKPRSFPQEFVREMEDAAKSMKKEIEEIQQGSQEVSARLDKLAKKAKEAQKFADEHSSLDFETPGSVSAEGMNEDQKKEIRQQLEARIKQDEEIPLVLVSAASRVQEKGTQALHKLWSRDRDNRFEDEIPRDEKGLVCVRGSRANFTFWAPYPMWATDFHIMHKRMSASTINEFKIVAFLDKQVVYESEVVKVMGTESHVSSKTPVRFRKLVVVALQSFGGNDGSEICVADMKAFAAPRIE